MPANKNAMTRYVLIDKMLANHYRSYSIQDITDELAKKLPEYGQNPVTKRCVEKDIYYLRYESPFTVDIEEYWVEASDRNDNPYKKRCIRYSDPSFSIFKSKLTEEETTALSAALDTMGSFEGLEAFERIDELKRSLKVKDTLPIIYLSKNILSSSSMIELLYTLIRNEVAITLSYHTFRNPQVRTVDVSPYMLREYNNRWFLIASAYDTGQILTFAVDRIDAATVNPALEFTPAPEDLRDRYEDIIGITYIEDNPVLEICFWVSEKSMDYVLTKPIHGSQMEIRKEAKARLATKYKHLEGGAFFKIKCKENYELIRELCSFGSDLIVLSPKTIVNKVRIMLTSALELYSFNDGIK